MAPRRRRADNPLLPVRELKDLIVGVKVPRSLVALIDEEAGSEGLSRSDVLRRVMLRHYRERARAALRGSR